jgi:hypothetical protein
MGRSLASCYSMCCLLVLLVCLDACLRCQADNKQEECVGKNSRYFIICTATTYIEN